MTPLAQSGFLGRLPSPHRAYALGLLLLQCGLVWYLMGGGQFAGSAALLGIAAAAARREQLLPAFRFSRPFAAATLIFLAKSRLFPHEVPSDNAFLYSNVAYELVCLILTMQLLVLWNRGRYEKLPTWYPLLAGLGLTFLGDLRLNPTDRLIFRGAVACACPLLLLQAAAARRIHFRPGQSPGGWGRRMCSVLAVVCGLSLGLVAAKLFAEHEPAFERWFDEYMSGHANDVSPGFTGELGLDSISHWANLHADRIAVRLSGARGETYLRGCAFNLYHNSRWYLISSTTQMEPAQKPSWFSELTEDSDEAEQLYFRQAPPRSATTAQLLQLWPEPHAGGEFTLITQNTAGILLTGPRPVLDGNGNLLREVANGQLAYRLLLDLESGDADASDTVREADLRIPADLDPRIQAVADEVLPDGISDSEKIRRVEDFFHTEFEYQLGVQIPRYEDRLAYFLERRLPAHCEYFASATAILLRLKGVPTRVITGYVAGEYNPVGDYWLARRGDAHAWVEAYDAQLAQWVIVESTPGAGVPQPRETAAGAAWWDVLTQLGRFSFQLLRTAPWRVLGWLIEILLAGFALAGLGYLIARRVPWPKWLLPRPARNGAPDQELAAEREALDRVLGRLGLIREPAETLHQFANRIQRHAALADRAALAGDCYRMYATVRFHPPSRELLTELRKLRNQLERP